MIDKHAMIVFFDTYPQYKGKRKDCKTEERDNGTYILMHIHGAIWSDIGRVWQDGNKIYVELLIVQLGGV